MQLKLKKVFDTFSNLVVIEHIPLGISAISFGALLGYGKIGVPPSLNALFLVFMTFVFLIFGFNVFNAIYDAKIDRVNKPYRPLANGTISALGATRMVLFSYLIAILLSFKQSRTLFFLVLLTVVVTVLYSLPPVSLKRVFFVGGFSVSFVYGILMVLAGFTIYSPLQKIPIPMVVATFLLTLPCSMLKDFEDYAGDKKYSSKSLPVVLGISKGAKIASFFVTLPYLFIFYLFTIGYLGFSAYKGITLLTPAVIAVWLAVSLIKDPSKKNSNRVFKGILITEFLGGIGLIFAYLT